MAQHATIDASGRLTGFFDDILHKTLPAGSVQLTPAQYEAWLANQGGLVWDHASGSLVPAPPSAATPAPVRVSSFQFKAQLFSMPGAEAGKTLLDDVSAFVGSAGALTQLAWTELPVFSANRNPVRALALHFGWGQAQLNEMFTAAAAIEA